MNDWNTSPQWKKNPITIVHHKQIVDRNHLKERTEVVFDAIKADEDTLGWTTENMLLQAELCFENNVGHFENYLE